MSNTLKKHFLQSSLSSLAAAICVTTVAPTAKAQSYIQLVIPSPPITITVQDQQRHHHEQQRHAWEEQQRRFQAEQQRRAWEQQQWAQPIIPMPAIIAQPIQAQVPWLSEFHHHHRHEPRRQREANHHTEFYLEIRPNCPSYDNEGVQNYIRRCAYPRRGW